jgi:hypothetical protein
MSEARAEEILVRTDRPRLGSCAGVAAEALRYGAAPGFALMAIFAANGGGASVPVCLPSSASWNLSGMAAMYALMSLVHAAPWLKALSGVRQA